MTAHASPSAFSGPRRALLIGCAIGGLCAAASQVDAQAFNALPKTVAGVVVYDRATPGVETVTIDSPSAIINWTPPGIPATFLPAGNTATFVNGKNVTDYAVLNRILTFEPIRFDGHVLGLIGDLAAGTAAPGGTIVFSSPGGIIIGSTAVFDVGNLVLTSLNVVDDGGGNFYDPVSQGLQFVPVGGGPQGAGVNSEPGAQINALSQSSFVAMVAPRIVHGGSVRVNGSAAFIAGERVQLRVNQGLFDIIVDSGTDNVTPLIHRGSTGGPASTGAGDLHGIYLVAVPRNQAITAVLQGNVGFDPAVNAAIENGVVVLSAGFNTAGGQVDRHGDFGPIPKTGAGASFEIRGGTVSSDLFGFAATDMLASGQATGNLAFLQDVSLFAGRRAHLFAGAGESVTVGGDALVSAAQNRTADASVIDHTGGEALIFAQNGGSIDIFGSAVVDASARGAVNPLTSTAGNGTGGRAGLFADGAGSSVRVRGDTQLLATGAGGVIDFAPNRGGAGQGGVAVADGRNGGRVRLDGTLAMDVSGTGSRSNGSGGIPAATGTGGALHVGAFGGGSITVAGATALTANGTGGDVTGSSVAGGTGRGGNVALIASGNVTLIGDVVLSADGFGGTGPTGGTAEGGALVLVSDTPIGGTGVLNAGNVTGTASATGAATSGNIPGEWHVNNSTGSTVNFVNLTLTASANGTLGIRPFSSLLAQGTINVTQLAQLTTPGEIRILGLDAGRIVGGRYAFAAGENVNLTHSSPVAGGFTIDVTDLFITAGSDFSAGPGVVTRTASQTDIRATGNAAVAGTMLGRDIMLSAAAIDVAASGVIGGTGTDLADLRALGNLGVAGRLFGRTIRLGSADIDIAATGAIGDAATQLVELDVAGALQQPAVLGGSAQGPGYTLTDAEAGRIRAGTLRLLAPALAAGTSLVVRDLMLNGGGAGSGIGILEIDTPGVARVEGALLMTNALAGNGISFTARERLEMVTPTGGIRVRDAGGAPRGTMLLSSNNIWIASQAIIDQLRLDPNYAGRDDDLVDNDGVDAPRGYVEAGGVTLASGGTLFVQNSTGATGAFLTGTDFGGITVGADGLTIQSTGTPATVTAFGRRLNADGSFTTGDDFFFEVSFFAGGAPLAAGYTAASAFNTCIIVTGQCPARVPPNLGPGGPDPVTGPTGGSAAIQLPGAAEEEDLVDTSFSNDPLIEEPVTSGGESSLWECDRDDDGDCDDRDD